MLRCGAWAAALSSSASSSLSHGSHCGAHLAIASLAPPLPPLAVLFTQHWYPWCARLLAPFNRPVIAKLLIDLPVAAQMGRQLHKGASLPNTSTRKRRGLHKCGVKGCVQAQRRSKEGRDGRGTGRGGGHDFLSIWHCKSLHRSTCSSSILGEGGGAQTASSDAGVHGGHVGDQVCHPRGVSEFCTGRSGEHEVSRQACT